MNMTMIKTFKALFSDEGFKEAVEDLMANIEQINTSKSEEEKMNLTECIEGWRKKYLRKTDAISIHGMMTRHIDVDIREFGRLAAEGEEWREYLLKILLIDCFMGFKDVHQCNQISSEEFIADMEYYFNFSNKQYSQFRDLYNADYVKRLDAEYPRFAEYINYFKNDLTDYSVVRINKLGECEGENTNPTQTAWYFVVTNENVHMLTLREFM